MCETKIDKQSKTIEIRYKLNLLQRLVNPYEKFGFQIIGVVGLLPILYYILMINLTDIGVWLIFVIGLLFFGRFMKQAIIDLVERDPYRFLVIDKSNIGFGKYEVEYKLSKNVKLEKGFINTLIIRHPIGISIVVSEKAISKEELESYLFNN